MGLKFFTIALVAFLSLQGFAEAKHVDVAVAVPLNLEEIWEQIQELINYIKQTLGELEGEIAECIKQIIELVKKQFSELLAQLKIVVENVRQQVIEILQTLKEHKEKCINCILEQKDTINTLLIKTHNDTIKCAQNTLGVLLNELILKLEGPIKKIKEAVAEIKECTNIFCVIPLAKTIYDSLSDAVEITEKVLSKFPVGFDNFLKCTAVVQNEFVETFTVIRENVKACINE